MAQNNVNNELSGNLSDQAKNDLRSFAKFYLWASALFDLGHVIVKGNAVSFTPIVSKRFSVGVIDGVPSIGFQSSELEWVRYIPWSWAAVNVKAGLIFLTAKPADPLNMIVFIINIDTKDKLKFFEGKSTVQLINMPGSISSDNFRTVLTLKEVDDEKYSTAKLKHKKPSPEQA